MQLHRQLSELREGGARRGEDLSDLGAGQRYGGPAHIFYLQYSISGRPFLIRLTYL